MVNRASWDQVAAPDFSVALRALESAGDRFDKGIGAARSGIAGIDNLKNVAVNKAFQLEMAKFTDPAALQAALAADPTLGLNARRLTSETIQSGGAKVTGLINQLGLKSDFDLKERTRARDVARQEKLTAATPLLNKAIQLADINTPESRQALLDLRATPEWQATAGQLDYDQLEGAMADLRTGTTGRQGIQSTEESNRRTLEVNQNSTEDRTVDLKTSELDGVLGNFLDPDEGSRYYFDNRDALVAAYGQRAYDRAGAQRKLLSWGETPSGAGGGAMPSSSGDTGGAFGGTPMQSKWAVPNSAENVAALQDLSKATGYSVEDLAVAMSYETGGKFSPGIIGGKNNNHRGLIQFGKEEREEFGYRDGMTFAEQVRGPVMKYLQKRGAKGDRSLLDLYSTINAGSPGLYDKSDNGGKDTVRSHVARMRSQHGANALAFIGSQGNPRAARVASNTAIAATESGAPMNDFARIFVTNKDNPAQTGEVANALAALPTFKGHKVENIAAAVEKIKTDYKTNSTIAGEMLKMGYTGPEGLGAQMGDAFRNLLGTGDGLSMGINWDEIKRIGESLKNPQGLIDQVVRQDTLAQNAAQGTAADDAVASLSARNKALASRARRTGRRYSGALEEIELGEAIQQRDSTLRTSARDAITSLTSSGRNEGIDPPAPAKNTSAPSQATTQKAIVRARKIQGLGGAIRDREAAKFASEFGVDPVTALADPSTIQQQGARSVTTDLGPAKPNALKTRLQAEARIAIKKGPAAEKAFKAKYGSAPQLLLR